MYENKMTLDDLRRLQGLPLGNKILITQTRIMEWYMRNDGKVYVSFSGGKDSTVLLDIVRKIYPDVPAVFVDTGLEYPEIREFVKTMPNVIWLHPIKYDKHKMQYVRTNFREVIQTYGYPLISKDVSNCIYYAKKGSRSRLLRLYGESKQKDGNLSLYNCKKWKFMLDSPFDVSDKCCDIMKKKPVQMYNKDTGRKPMIALLACESLKRRNDWLKTGCNAFDKKNPQSQPMAFWTEQDVLQYLKEYNVPYASVYGDIIEDENGRLKTAGCHRTGCIFCGFGCHLEKEPNRFQMLKITHPNLWEYCMKPWDEGGLGMKEPLEFIGVKTE